LAKRIGRSGAARAVGAAAGKNPLPIIVPCHRLIGSNGQLTGFASGLVNKRTLLALEQSAGLFRR
jgi:methylated-DNA-[protein]-cysteine S-methyltransferase